MRFQLTLEILKFQLYFSISINSTLTNGHTTSLQLCIRRLVVVWKSYDITMTLCVLWVGGISSKKLFLFLKNKVRDN